MLSKDVHCARQLVMGQGISDDAGSHHPQSGRLGMRASITSPLPSFCLLGHLLLLLLLMLMPVSHRPPTRTQPEYHSLPHTVTEHSLITPTWSSTLTSSRTILKLNTFLWTHSILQEYHVLQRLDWISRIYSFVTTTYMTITGLQAVMVLKG